MAVPRRDPAAGRLLLAAGVGAAVALALGRYGAAHEPDVDLAITLGFSATINMKVWLATAAILFALFQLTSALWMWGRLPLAPEAPASLGTVHRISGRLAFLLSLPVAYHCLYQLGLQTGSTRVLVHSLVGCAFYGAFAAKILVVRSEGLPGLALPLAGATVFTMLVVAWLTSGFWYMTDSGIPSL